MHALQLTWSNAYTSTVHHTEHGEARYGGCRGGNPTL